MNQILRVSKSKLRALQALCLIAIYGWGADALAGEWFPKTFVDPKSANKEGMQMFSDVLVKGFKILLFSICIVCFVQFVRTVSHGIEEAKRSEGGLMSVFTSYAVMSLMYLGVSITCAYVGFTAVTNFSL